MIFIQSNLDKTLPHHFDACCAMYGAIGSGLDYKFINYEELSIKYMLVKDRQNMFIGTTEFMTKVWEILEKTSQAKVPRNSDREHYKSTLGEIRFYIDKTDKKRFIKPFQQKLFTGLVVDKYSIQSLREFPDDTSLMVYPVIDKIISEWRLYIHHHKIVDSRNYSGDFKISPNYKMCEYDVIHNKETFPEAYVMDVGIYGINSNAQTIIEYNDMWAIGNYGLENELYLRMLRDRYYEIIKTNI